MDLYNLLLVSLLIWTDILSAYKHGHKFRGNFWKNSEPGELLSELDAITVDELQNRNYFKPLTVAIDSKSKTISPLKKRAQIKKSINGNKKTKSKPIRRMTTTEDDSAPQTSASAEHQNDYDRTYEQFVGRYFNDAADHYLSESEADDESVPDAKNLSGSIETGIVPPLDAQPFETSSKAKQESQKNCRQVHKNGENCLICKNPRTYEHSETCSYEHSSEPEKYAFETQRNFRENRDSRDGSEEDGEEGASVESDSSEFVAESKLHLQTATPEASINTTNVNDPLGKSPCIKRTAGGRACYYCRDGLGELKVNCLVSKPVASEPTLKSKPLDENSYKKRRIFKRTLSYVFEKEHNRNGTLDDPKEFLQNSTEVLK